MVVGFPCSHLNFKYHACFEQRVPTSDKVFKPSHRTDSFRITIGTINSWNETQHHCSNLSLKAYFLKNALKTINEEVKRGKYKFN